MVRTLTNAFNSGRLAHAFILTGVRGVGKTTTARIIAKALNCVGPDGTGGPTIEPCGICEFCNAISEDRHMDVLEMDAASRTGVEDIRELIEGVRYLPASARYKVYIIDEIHMLSGNAFNALLKTLEEPPTYVKFILATTEIRKVPATVLSRCQRFDLRRVDTKTLSEHFSKITEMENARISTDALAVVARVADGSVRDGQSLLDQIITTAARDQREIGDSDVREILGLADRERTFDLLELVLNGQIEMALDTLSKDYHNGANPLLTLQDMLELVHWLTRVKVSPSVLLDLSNAESERVRGQALAEKLSIASLSRAWQMLLKGLQEAQNVPSPIQAVEMILVRLAYLSDLPAPADAVRTLMQGDVDSESGLVSTSDTGRSNVRAKSPGSSQAINTAQQLPPQSEGRTDPKPQPQNLEEVIALLSDYNERILMGELVNKVHLVSFEEGKIEIRLAEGALPDTPQRLYKFLNVVTERRWTVSLAMEGGEETLKKQKSEQKEALHSEVVRHPLMQSVMEIFPGAEIETIRNLDSTDEVPMDKYQAEGKDGV